jgi:hypothetical protein
MTPDKDKASQERWAEIDRINRQASRISFLALVIAIIALIIEIASAAMDAHSFSATVTPA